MCFSATASFSTSVVLAAVGTLTVVRTKEKRHKPLALIPLFFAIQQFFEGILWLYLPHLADSYWAIISKNAFLGFAYVFWPIWIPLSLWIAEKNSSRKQLLAILLGLGVTLAAFLLLIIPYSQSISYKASIIYELQMPDQTQMMAILFARVRYLALGIYCLATLFPLFFSSMKRFWLLGILITLAAVVIFWIDKTCFASLWCFFAAIFSVGLAYLLPLKKKS